MVKQEEPVGNTKRLSTGDPAIVVVPALLHILLADEHVSTDLRSSLDLFAWDSGTLA